MARKKTIKKTSRTKQTNAQLRKEIDDIKKEFGDVKKEIKEDIKKIVKNRAVLENQKIGKKIDSIMDDDFVEEIRGKRGKPSILEQMRNNEKDHETYNRVKKTVDGNGDVGLSEEARSIKRQIKFMWIVVVILFILSLGGNFRGVTWKSIRQCLGFGTETTQVDPNSNNIKNPIMTP